MKVLPLLVAFSFLAAAVVFAEEAKPELKLSLSAEGDGEIWNLRITLCGADSVASGKLILTKEGRELWQKELPALRPGETLPLEVDLKPFGTGPYDLNCSALQDGKIIAAAERKIYYLDAPWRAMDLSPSPVLEPWTPIEATPDGKVKCWGREYSFGKDLLPASIVSQAREVLSRPVTIIVEVGGEKATLALKPLKVERKEEGAVEYSVSGRVSRSGEVKEIHPAVMGFSGAREAAQGLDITFSARSTIEYDGLIMTDLILEGAGIKEVTGLVLEIPVCSDACKYVYRSIRNEFYTASKTVLRGQPGIMTRDDFFPYARLGDDDIGLFWFCDSNEQWPHSLGGGDDSIVVEDRADEVVLRLTILKAPEKLETPWRFRFGLMGTPAKPGANSMKRRRGWGTAIAGKEISLSWGQKAFMKNNDWPEPKDESVVINMARNSWKRGRIPIFYTLAHTIAANRPEWLVFGARWHNDGATDGWWDNVAWQPKVNAPLMNCCPWTEHNLVLAWKIMENIKKYDFGGYYRDGVFGLPCANQLHGHGRNGSVTWGMEPQRLTFRWLYKEIRKFKGDRSYIMFHSSAQNPLPLLIYSDAILIGENVGYRIWKYKADYRKVIPLHELRSEYMGRSWGFLSVLLPLAKGEAYKFATVKQTRCMAGMMLLHDIWFWEVYCHEQTAASIRQAIQKNFDWVNADCFPYFDEASPAKVLGKDIYITLYRRDDGKTLAVVVNLSDENLRTWITFDPKGLGLAKISKCRDIENDMDFPVVGGKRIRIVVPATDFRLLVVE